MSFGSAIAVILLKIVDLRRAGIIDKYRQIIFFIESLDSGNVEKLLQCLIDEKALFNA